MKNLIASLFDINFMLALLIVAAVLFWASWGR